MLQVSLKIMPGGNSQEEVYSLVNQSIGMINASGLHYIVGPSETTIEGEYKQIFQLIEKIHEHLLNNGVRQLGMIIMTDYNQEGTYIDGKLKNVDKYLKGDTDEN